MPLATPLIQCVIPLVLFKCPIQYEHQLQDDVAGCFEYYADLAEKLDAAQDATIALPAPEFKAVLRKDPLGAVGLISAWNYPALIAAVAHQSSAKHLIF